MSAKNIATTITIGGVFLSSLKSALSGTKQGVDQIGGAVRKLENRQKDLNRVIAEQSRLGKSGSALAVRYANQELGTLNKQIEALKVKNRLQQAAHAGIRSGKAQMAGGGIALGVVGAVESTAILPIKQAAEFETAMLGVSKQVDGARDSSGKLTQVYYDMEHQIKLMGRSIPLATDDIAEMVAAGARMGIAKEALIEFTKTSAMMATAFELPAGELADQMGKIGTLFAIPTAKIGELADSINYLDDNAISKGGDIIEVMKRIGGTAQMLKMPAKDAAALGSTFLSLGSSAEIAATASNAVMRELSIATMQPKRFKAGLTALKMDAKKVQNDMAKDATGTILKVLDALNKLPKEQQLTVATQLFGKEYGDDVSKLAGSVSEYRRQLQLANSEKAKGSMKRESDAKNQTTEAQWTMAKNRLTELSVNIGTILLPAVKDFLGVIGSLITPLAEFVKANPKLSEGVISLAGAVLLGVGALGALKLGVGAVGFAFNVLKLAMATNPIGLVLVGLTAAAFLIYKYWTPIGAFFRNLWAGLVDGANAAFNWIIDKLSMVGKAWDGVKSFFGLGGGSNATVNVKQSTELDIPPMATNRAPATVNNSSSNSNNTSITINTQPNQSPQAIAKQVQMHLDAKKKDSKGNALHDMAMGY